MNPEPRFLCDAMLGSLARWLRFFGYDCTYSAELDDRQLAVMAEAEGRWLLTRDRELAATGPRTVLVRSHYLDEQLQEVFVRRHLQPRASLDRSRCGVCNGELRSVTAAEVADRVPPLVARTVTSYRRCLSCGRVYWPGSHSKHILDRMHRISETQSRPGCQPPEGEARS